jgi:drug/metabolite transporter (DMT)-like permease
VLAAYAALWVAVVLWGLSFPVMKHSVARLGSFDVGFFRILLGAVGSLGLAALWGAVGPAGSVRASGSGGLSGPKGRVPLFRALRRHAGALCVLSVLVGYGQTFTFTYGLAMTPATIGSLIPPLNPICTMLLAALLLGEPVTRRQWVGLVLGVAGVILLGFRHGVPTWASLAGPALLAVAPISWAFYTVLSKPLLQDIAPMTLTAATLGGGLLLVLPWVDRGAPGRLIHAAPLDWAALLFLGLVCMGLCYGLWYIGLARIGASATGATVLGIPLVGVLSSWLLLGEPVGAVVIVAGALILGGLQLVLGGQRG